MLRRAEARGNGPGAESDFRQVGRPVRGCPWATRMAAAVWLGIIGVLMISRLPTLSPKAMRVPRWGVGALLMGTVIGMGLIFSRFWAFMVLIDLIYVATLLPALWRSRGRILR